MRTFPRSLATFHKIVDEKGQQLRTVAFKELERLNKPTEHIIVESRPATISIIVEN